MPPGSWGPIPELLPSSNARPTCRATSPVTLVGMSTSHEDESAAEAAARLPTQAVDVSGVVIGLTTFVLAGGGGLVLIAVEAPDGWLAVLAGLPLYLLCRLLVFRLRGTETATITVDDGGVLHVVRGERSVRRMTRLFQVGNRRWMLAVWLQVVLLLVVGLTVPIVLAVNLDSPAPALACLSRLGYAMLDFVRHVAFTALVRRRAGVRLLDSSVMLPLLALYAHHQGWEAATRDLPANELIATVTRHPSDLETVARYRATNQKMAKLAYAVNGVSTETMLR